jgi:MFS family permease
MFGIGFGICSPIVLTLVASGASKEYLATVISVNGAFCNLGRIIGPLMMGVAFGIGGISGVFYAGAGLRSQLLLFFRYCPHGMSLSGNEPIPPSMTLLRPMRESPILVP